MKKRDFSHAQCGECGERQFIYKNLKDSYKTRWKDFPKITISVDFTAWECQICKNVAFSGSDLDSLDNAANESIRIQASAFIDVIKSRSKITSKKLSTILGVSPEYLSVINSKTKTPSFQLWNLLRVISQDPCGMVARFDPNESKSDIIVSA